MGQMSVSEITKVNFGERGGGVGEVLLDNGADVSLRDNKGKLIIIWKVQGVSQ